VRLRDASSEAFDRVRNVCNELTQSHIDAPFVLGCSGSLLARWFIPRLGRLNADLPDLRLHLSAGEGDLDPVNRDSTPCWCLLSRRGPPTCRCMN
jgi:DNA-binding transcriptional LysR family regulator